MTTSPDHQPFTPDKSGQTYLLMDRTAVEHWRDLKQLIHEINSVGHRAITHHQQAAADVEFATTWNRLVRQYTAKRAPISGVRMRRLVARVKSELQEEASNA